MRAIFLVDNGSLKPAAVFNLRRVAAALGDALGEPVEPASLLHSNKIPFDELGGEPARTLGPAAERRAEAGAREIIIIPFFFGESRALTDYLPKRMAELQERFPRVSVRVAMPLVDERGDNDLRLARLLADNVMEVVPDGAPPRVALVDHGSPIFEVTAVRNRLAGQLGALLGERAACVAPASMERRDGEAYRFNEPLLENLLESPDFRDATVVVALLFLSPGRHAGEDGDIAEICRQAQAHHPRLRVITTRLVGEHEGIVDILRTRFQQVTDHGRVLLELAPRGGE
ncbi:CbiX/SirB N-terminal domain-containing protein [Halomonas sp. PAMB 3264]|uniref:sirohydrochlorin chelatase n=1 Tax=Halomonas sp. PAMB 3264 TaxID=3075222 RepID=UPI0028A2A7A5|nr:CbiX/SirB N-terminal domain-containing protein [Halomonas sp. PAMB 3264]WNL41998.1 CbiX/SirB N-terminal domain-containing protein [Halomonas sp. PAMB 3264]